MSRNQPAQKSRSPSNTAGSNMQLDKVSEMQNAHSQSRRAKINTATKGNVDLIEVQSPASPLFGLGEENGNVLGEEQQQSKQFHNFHKTNIIFKPQQLQVDSNAFSLTQQGFLTGQQRPQLDQAFDQQQMSSFADARGELTAFSATPVLSAMGVNTQTDHAELDGRNSQYIGAKRNDDGQRSNEFTHIVIPSGFNETNSRRSSERTREGPEFEDNSAHQSKIERILIEDARQQQQVAHQESNTLQHMQVPITSINAINPLEALSASELQAATNPQYLTQRAIRVAVQKKPQQSITNVVFSSKEPAAPSNESPSQTHDVPAPKDNSAVRDKDAFLGKKIRPQPQSKYLQNELKKQNQQLYPELQIVSQNILPTKVPPALLLPNTQALVSAVENEHSGTFRQGKRQKIAGSSPNKQMKNANGKQKSKGRKVEAVYKQEVGLGITPTSGPDQSRSSRRSNRGISPFNYNTADSSGRNTQTRLVDYPNGKSQLERIPESENQGKADVKSMKTDVIMVSFQHSPNRSKARGSGNIQNNLAPASFAANGKVISGAKAQPHCELAQQNCAKKSGVFSGLIMQRSPVDKFQANSKVSPTSSQFHAQITQPTNRSQYNFMDQMSIRQIILDDQLPDYQTEIINSINSSPQNQQSWRPIRQVIHVRPGDNNSLEQSPRSTNQYSAQVSPIRQTQQPPDLDQQIQEVVREVQSQNHIQQTKPVTKPRYCPKTFQIHGSQISMTNTKNKQQEKLMGQMQKHQEIYEEQKREKEDVAKSRSPKTYIIMVENDHQSSPKDDQQQWSQIPDGYKVVRMDMDQLDNLDQEVKLSDLIEKQNSDSGNASNGGSNQVAIIIGTQNTESSLPEILTQMRMRINQNQESQKANKREFSPNRAKKFIKQSKTNKFRFDLNTQYNLYETANAKLGLDAYNHDGDKNIASFGTLNQAQSPKDDGDYTGHPSLAAKYGQYSPLSIVEGPMLSLRETRLLDRFKNSPTTTLNKDSVLDNQPRQEHHQPNPMQLTITKAPKAEKVDIEVKQKCGEQIQISVETEDAGERSAPKEVERKPRDSTGSLPEQWQGVESNPSPPLGSNRGSLSKMLPQKNGVAGFGSVLGRQKEASRAINNAGPSPEISQIQSSKICSVSKLTQKPKIPRNLPTPMKASLMKRMELDQEKSQRTMNPNYDLQLNLRNHAATGIQEIVCEAESVTSRTVTPNIRDIAILARKKKQLNVPKNDQIKIVHSTVSKHEAKNVMVDTGRTSPADAMNLTYNIYNTYNGEFQEPLSATAPIYPTNQQTISRFPPLRQRQISPRYRSSAKQGTLLERLNQVHKAKDEQSSAVDQEETQLTLNSQEKQREESREGSPTDQTNIRVGIEIKRGIESNENKSLMNAVQDQKVANQVKYARLQDKSNEQEHIQKEEDRQFRKYIYDQFNVTGDFQSSKPKIIYSNISNDPLVKYVRRINNNDYWQGRNAEKLHQTMISQYSQDYQKLCVMHPGPQSQRLYYEDVNTLSSKEFTDKKMDYLQKQSIANRLKTHKYLNISEQLDFNGRTPLPHSFTATQNIEVDYSAIEANLNKTTLNINSETNMPSIFEHRRLSEVAKEENKQKKLEFSEDYFPRHQSNARGGVHPQFFKTKSGMSPFLQKKASRNLVLDSFHNRDDQSIQSVFQYRNLGQAQAPGAQTIACPSDSGLSNRNDEPETAYLRMQMPPHDALYTTLQSNDTEAQNTTEPPTPILISHYAHGASDHRTLGFTSRSTTKKQRKSTHVQHWPAPPDGSPVLELSGNRFNVKGKHEKQMEDLMNATFRNNQENISRKMKQI